MVILPVLCCFFVHLIVILYCFREDLLMQISMKNFQDSLYQYYEKEHMPVWIYNQNNDLCFTNFTTPILLHLMDTIKPLIRNYVVSSAVDGYRVILDYPYESYYAFTWHQTRRISYTVLVGPVLPARPTIKVWNHYSFRKAVFEDQREALIDLLPIMTLEVFLKEITVFLKSVCQMTAPDFSRFFKHFPKNEHIHDEITCTEESCRCKFAHMNPSELHEKEECLRYYIRNGNAYRLYTFLEDTGNREFLFPDHSSLSDCIIRAAELMTIGRLASVEGGYSTESSYYLYRNYMDQIRECRCTDRLISLVHKCLCEFSNYTHQVVTYTRKEYSPLINKCIQQIIEQMPDKITLEDLAESIHLSPKYLSALFNKETGSSITDFMQDMRIEEAKHLLLHSDLSYLEISNLLNFSSQSYFNCIFKKKTGLTPKEFRCQSLSAENSSVN